jgi:signal transduction histidine kinase
MSDPGYPADPDADEIQRMMLRELRRILDNLVRLRFFASLVLGGFAAVFAWADTVAWRAWLLAGAAVLLSAMALYDLRTFRRMPVTVGRQTYLMAGVMVMHFGMILVTGGIRSPFIVLPLVLTTIGALSLGRLRHLLVLGVPSVALIWTLAVLDALGTGPMPLSWLGSPGAPGGVHAWFFAAVLTVAMVIGAAVALAHRRALDRAIRRTAVASRETWATFSERNREAQALSGALAHELKNPLASIQGLAGLLVRKLPEGSREGEQVGVLLGEARRMGAILDQFLNFSRPVGALTLRSVDPARLVSDVATLHEGFAEERGLRLETDCEAATLRCDPRKVKQVLVNLLRNALEATPRGGAVTLRVRTAADGSVGFRVEDEGPGLAAEVRGRLFCAGVTTKPDGTGLGLVIARSIAEQHGGTLTLTDRPGGGCAAEFSIPATLPEAAAGGGAR